MSTAPASPRHEPDATVLAGVATCDITPTGPMAMSGYATRVAPSAGVHDRLSVRALVIERTAIVTVDVVGLHEGLCAQVKESTSEWVDHVVVHATHTHSGPASVPGRLGGPAVVDWLNTVAAACVEAVRQASEACEPARITAGYGESPGIARNRRRVGGPVDDALPLMRCDRLDGRPLALLVSYACHPVVLDAENLLFSADYPGVVRQCLERETGATVLFATSCAGDLNTGHPVGAAPTSQGRDERTFRRCELVGRTVADSASRGLLSAGSAPVKALGSSVSLTFSVPPAAEVSHEAERWARLSEACADTDRPLFDVWLRWAARFPEMSQRAWDARVSVLQWGAAVVVALPGEPFCAASREIRRRVTELTGAKAVLVLGYSNGCPGYFPTADEYALGGYEVDEAHRYYGMPGPFTAGSLERLIEEVVRVTHRLTTM